MGKLVQNCVYFLQEGYAGRIKGGRTSRTVLHRLRELQTGNPHRIRVLGVVPTETYGFTEDLMQASITQTKLLERNIQWIFRAIKLDERDGVPKKSEWFRPHDSLLQYISRHAVPCDEDTGEVDMDTLVEMFESSRICPYCDGEGMWFDKHGRPVSCDECLEYGELEGLRILPGSEKNRVVVGNFRTASQTRRRAA